MLYLSKRGLCPPGPAEAAVAVIVSVVLLGAEVFAAPQESREGLAFEVASVKINKANESSPSKISDSAPGRFVAANTPLRFLILYAYRLLDHQLVGVPEWASSVSIDITATYPPGSAPNNQEIRQMLQKLLAERFALVVHTEQREAKSYSLVVAKEGRLGPQLQRSDVNCEKWIADKRPQADAGGPSTVTPSKKRPACMMLATRRWLSGGTRTMPQLAATLQSMLQKPVVDRTGLTGAFDVDLHWNPSETGGAPSDDTSASEEPPIVTAVQEQLGLKLTPARNTFDVVVVDRVAPPTAN